MRVTQTMLAQNSLRYLNQSYEKLGRLQDQFSTGKKITRASQDPVVAMNGMRYRTQSVEVSQFKRNVSEVYNWMESTDSALDKATQAVKKVRELVNQASNDTYEEGQRANIAKEVSQLFDHVVSIANTKVNNKYIFNGTDTTNPPVDETKLPTDWTDVQDLNVASTNEEDVEIELLKGVTIPVNSRPQNVFSNELFSELKQIELDLHNPEKSGEDFTKHLETIDKHINNMVNERAEIGARLNRVEMIDGRLGEQEVIAKRVLSDNEDADMEKVIIDLMTQENVHRAALGAGARIIQPSLLDFLR
ncbi:flagellar hook-associated protein FlgL [Bacillus piscicola]|uniref:flagellar hook-associated protein FlgL n=1 Tax=Bacillus piscicola TaxID=1632684 RepID=UPI001F09CD3C|nr:flagellar hook-associated protein FlgL [Bacillus piscicola]